MAHGKGLKGFEMNAERKGMKLIEVMVIVFVVSILTGVLVPALAESRKSARKRDCTNNLAQLGMALRMYVSTIGCNGVYPPATGQNFFNTLRRCPTVKPFAQDDKAFVCDVLGGAPSPTRLDYRNANPAAYGSLWTGEGWTSPNYPIGADKTTNHDINGQDDVNVLLFGGSVIRATPGDVNWTMAITQGYTQ